MDFITTLVSYGLLFIGGFILISLLVTALSFFICGKILGAINDEFNSALKLLGISFLIGLVSGLLGILISLYLDGNMALVVGILVILGQLAVMIRYVSKVYDLEIGKSILFMLLTIVINGAIMFLLVLGVGFIIPQNNTPTIVINNKIKVEKTDEEEATVKIGAPCTISECGEEGVCLVTGECATIELLEAEYEQGNCKEISCENCASENLVRGFTAISPDKTTNYCIECDPFSYRNSCKVGFSCFVGKCIPWNPENPKGTLECEAIACEKCEIGTQASLLVSAGDGELKKECVECHNSKKCKEGYTCQDNKCIGDSVDEPVTTELPKLPKITNIEDQVEPVENSEPETISDTSTSPKSCWMSGDCSQDEYCFYDKCRSKEYLVSIFQTEPFPSCASAKCETCANGKLMNKTLNTLNEAKDAYIPLTFCMECDGDEYCIEDAVCHDGKCVNS